MGRTEVSTDVPQTAELFDANSGCMCCHVVISTDRAVSPALRAPWRCSSAGPVQSTSCLSGSDALVGVSRRISLRPVFTFVLRGSEDASVCRALCCYPFYVPGEQRFAHVIHRQNGSYRSHSLLM